jgi:hypothetical protein
MVLELASLVVGIINAIFAGIPIFTNLWHKIKSFFGGSRKFSLSLPDLHLEAVVSPEYCPQGNSPYSSPTGGQPRKDG